MHISLFSMAKANLHIILSLLVYLLAITSITGFSAVPDRIEALYGQPIHISEVKLFNNIYYVHELQKNGVSIYLPFTSNIPNENNLISDSNLAQLVLEVWQFDQITKSYDIEVEKEQALVPIRDYYAPWNWWDTATCVVVPAATPFYLYSKARVFRSNLGSVSLWGANELFKAICTQGASSFSLTWSGLKELYDLNNLDYPPGALKNEIQTLVFAQAECGGKLDVLSGLMAAANIPDLSFFIKLGDGWNILYGYKEPAECLMNARIAAGAGDMDKYLTNIRKFDIKAKELGIGLAIDIGEDIIFNNMLGWSSLNNEIKVSAWLIEAHREGINVVASHIIDIGETIYNSRKANDSPDARAALSRALYRYLYEQGYLLYPLIAEHYAVQMLHLSRIHSNYDTATSWWLGASEKHIDEFLTDYNTLVTQECSTKRKQCDSYWMSLNKIWSGYEGALSLIYKQHSDLLLEVKPPVDRLCYINEKTIIYVPCVNQYAMPASIQSISGGTAKGGISIIGKEFGIVESGKESLIIFEVVVPGNWYTQNNSDAQNMDINVSITWQVADEQHTKYFCVPIIIASRVKIDQVFANKNMYNPDSIATLTFKASGLNSGDTFNLTGILLRPDGQKQSLSFSRVTQGVAQLAYSLPNGPFGEYGVEAILSEDLGEVVSPITYANHLFYLIPKIKGDLGVINKRNIYIIYNGADSKVAEDIQAILDVNSMSMIVVDNRSLDELLQIAAEGDSILIGGINANPLVAQLTSQGKVNGNVTSNGDALVQVISSSFGSRNSVVVAGYRLSDTQVAAMGL